MKKINKINFYIVLLTVVLMNGAAILLESQNIEFSFIDLNLSSEIEFGIIGGLYLLLLVPTVIVLAKKGHDLKVKMNKVVQLKPYVWLLFITSFITVYSAVYFDLNYYYQLLGIVTLLIIYLVMFKFFDSKYVMTSQKSTIKVDNEMIGQLLTHLGGESNIITVSFDFSRLKVELVNVKRVNLEAIKGLGATGIFIAGNKMQAFVGNDAEKLETALKHYLSQS